MIFEFLQKIPLFSGLPEEVLHQLCVVVETVELPAGKKLFSEGDEGDRAYIIKEGVIEIVTEADGREILLAVRGEGVVIGEMALLESITRTATIRARHDTVLYAITKEELDNLLKSNPEAMEALFHTILGRLRENQVQVRQSEKMAQLGTLTAGVAHELNNPAAAVQRGADQLEAAIHTLNGAYSRIAELRFDNNQLNSLGELAVHVKDKAKSPPELDMLARSDREQDIETWLEEHKIEDSWEVAPTMVNLDFDEAKLDTLATESPAERLVCITSWLNATYNVYSLLKEIGEGSKRMSSIVKSLKSYAYLDQAPVQSVNINEGIDDTLVIMHNKIKSNVNVKRQYAEDLPEIQGYGIELNQVWTNIIDNACDALEETEDAEIIIRSFQDSSWVVVEIEDNGPGIPEEIQNRIFDSFFTTKAPGKGTGLGLDISYRIVVLKHRGDIGVKSKPGETVFTIRLPINFEEV